MPRITVKLEGAEELIEHLKTLGPKIERKVVRGAISKASTLYVRAARKNARRILRQAEKKGYRRKQGQHLYETIAKRIKTYVKNGVVFCASGPRAKLAPHAHLLEFGHRIVVGGSVKRKQESVRKSKTAALQAKGGRGQGRVVGEVRPYPFMVPAWDETRQTMLTKVMNEIGEGVVKEATKKG
jgi:HK97 gp10 family phage protein